MSISQGKSGVKEERKQKNENRKNENSVMSGSQYE